MSAIDETFFTRIGCIDGRVQIPVRMYGQNKFHAQFPDTITDAGEVGIITHNPTSDFLDNLKKEINISLNAHNSKGIVIHGHQECAGNPVDDQIQKEDIKKSVEKIKEIINNRVPVVGIFVKRSHTDPNIWEVEEL